MPFGEYKGVDIADVPDDYLEWVRALTDLRTPLRDAIEAEWEGRHALRTEGVSAAVLTMAADVVVTGYRTLAKTHHPDHGGDGRAMTLLNAAVGWLRQVVRVAGAAR